MVPVLHGRKINMAISKAWRKQLESLQNVTVPHLIDVIVRHIANDSTLPDYFTDKPVAYYEGLLVGTYSQIENVLRIYSVYNGYSIKSVGKFNDGREVEERLYYVPNG